MSARACSICEKPMVQGYYCCGEYYCSRECLDHSFQMVNETWEEHFTEDGDCYWTVWEEVVEKGAASIRIELRAGAITVTHGTDGAILSTWTARAGDWDRLWACINDLKREAA